MKKVLSTIVAAIVAVSFAGLAFAAQEPASATGPSEPTETKQVVKHHTKHHAKHHKKHHKSSMKKEKKEEAAPAAPAGSEAPAAK